MTGEWESVFNPPSRIPVKVGLTGDDDSVPITPLFDASGCAAGGKTNLDVVSESRNTELLASSLEQAFVEPSDSDRVESPELGFESPPPGEELDFFEDLEPFRPICQNSLRFFISLGLEELRLRFSKFPKLRISKGDVLGGKSLQERTSIVSSKLKQ